VKWFKAAGDAVRPGDKPVRDRNRQDLDGSAGDVQPCTLAAINFGVGETAKVGAVVAQILAAGERLPLSRRNPRRRKPLPLLRLQRRLRLRLPLLPPQSRWTLGRKFVRPARNFGPAKLASGTYVTPLARRLASDARH